MKNLISAFSLLCVPALAIAAVNSNPSSAPVAFTLNQTSAAAVQLSATTYNVSCSGANVPLKDYKTASGFGCQNLKNVGGVSCTSGTVFIPKTQQGNFNVSFPGSSITCSISGSTQDRCVATTCATTVPTCGAGTKKVTDSAGPDQCYSTSAGTLGISANGAPSL